MADYRTLADYSIEEYPKLVAEMWQHEVRLVVLLKGKRRIVTFSDTVADYLERQYYEWRYPEPERDEELLPESHYFFYPPRTDGELVAMQPEDFNGRNAVVIPSSRILVEVAEAAPVPAAEPAKQTRRNYLARLMHEFLDATNGAGGYPDCRKFLLADPQVDEGVGDAIIAPDSKGAPTTRTDKTVQNQFNRQRKSWRDSKGHPV